MFTPTNFLASRKPQHLCTWRLLVCLPLPAWPGPPSFLARTPEQRLGGSPGAHGRLLGRVGVEGSARSPELFTKPGHTQGVTEWPEDQVWPSVAVRVGGEIQGKTDMLGHAHTRVSRVYYL